MAAAMERWCRIWLAVFLLVSSEFACPAAELVKISQMGGYSYYKSESHTNWHDAEAKCQTIGAHLMTHGNGIETSILTDEMRGSSSEYWIGLNKLKSDVWKWASGHRYDEENAFRYWDKGYPRYTDLIPELCVEISSLTQGRWQTHHCNQRRKFFCRKVRGSPSPTPSRPIPGPCPDKYFGIGDKCYRLFPSGTHSWTDALRQCKEISGGRWPSLAAFQNIVENAAVTVQLESTPSPGFDKMWTGLYGHKGYDWFWADNSPNTWTNWAISYVHPQDGQCAYIRTKSDGSWLPADCDERMGFICQTYKVGEESPTEGPSPGNDTCPPGYSYYQDACYKFQNLPVVWANATDMCMRDNASLVSIHSAPENAAILLLLASQQPLTDSSWLGLQKTNSSWEWSDSSYTVYTLWDKEYPVESDDEVLCAEMWTDGRWHGVSCLKEQPFICKISLKNETDLHPHAGGTCPPSDHEFQWIDNPKEPFCYAFLGAGESNWQSHLAKCARSHTHASLVSVHSAEENAFIYDHASAATEYSNHVWLGLFRSKNHGSYMWTDGTAVQYEPWVMGHPDDKGDCAVLYLGKHANARRWVDVPCTDTSTAICKVSKVPPLLYPEDANGYCPNEEWKRYGSDCFLFRLDRTESWQLANVACENVGASLVTVEDAVKNDFLKEASHRVQSSIPQFFWLGLKRRDAASAFLWASSGEPADFKSFVTDFPPNDNTDCVTMKASTTDWFYTECVKSHGYVCQAAKTADKPTEAPSTPAHEGNEGAQVSAGSSQGLSGGDMAGVVIGCLLLVCLVGLAVFAVIKLRQRRALPADGLENQNYQNFENE